MGCGLNLLFAFVAAPSVLAACEPDAGFFEPDGAISGGTGGGATEAAAGLEPQSPPGPPYQYSPLSSGNSWTALYTDYFGPPQPVDGGQTGGRASCAGTVGNCHGPDPTPGVPSTGAGEVGFICPDKECCYQSLTGHGGDAGPACPQALGQVLFTSGIPFAQDYLYTGVLRSADDSILRSGPHNMPLGPPLGYHAPYIFTDLDIQRLSEWVDAGFPND